MLQMLLFYFRMSILFIAINLNLSLSVSREFILKCFQPFSASVEEEGVYKHLLEETNQYEEELKSKVKK